jgi:hypothetical protein
LKLWGAIPFKRAVNPPFSLSLLGHQDSKGLRSRKVKENAIFSHVDFIWIFQSGQVEG